MQRFVNKAYKRPIKDSKEKGDKNTESPKEKDYSVEIKNLNSKNTKSLSESSLNSKKNIKKDSPFKKINPISIMNIEQKKKKLTKELDQKNKEENINQKIILLRESIKRHEKENKAPTLDEVVQYLSFISPEIGSKILREYDDNEVLKITRKLLKKPQVEKSEQEFLKKKFDTYFKKIEFDSKIKGSNNLAKSFLEETLGKEEARRVYKKVLDSDYENIKDREKLLKNLSQYDTNILYSIIQNENELISTFIIMELENHKSAQVLSYFPLEKQKEIVKRISNMKRINYFAIDGIKEKIEEKAKMMQSSSLEKTNGKEKLEDIVKSMDIEEAEKLIENMNYTDPEMAKHLELVYMEHSILNRISEKDLQHILLGFSENNIAIMLVNKEKEFKDKILKNISSRRRETVLKEMEFTEHIPKIMVQSINESFMEFVKTLSH